MKGKSVLKRQAIKRRTSRNYSKLLRVMSSVASYALKSSCLLAGLVIVSLLFLSLYQYLVTSPYLKLERIIIEGLDEETERAVLKMSQLNLNTSLLAINMDKLNQRLEKHPWVRSVNLQKRFPHTLIIQAEREKPWAVVLMGNLYYMNRSGKIFKKVGPTDDIDYPLITGVSMTGNGKERKLKLASQVLRTLEVEKGPWALGELCEVHVKKNGNVSLFFRSLPATIKVRVSELDKKIGELKRLVAHLNRTGRTHLIREINLNYRDGAVVSFKNS